MYLDVDAVYTLSTIYSEGKQQPNNIPAPTAFPLPYMEDFNCKSSGHNSFFATATFELQGDAIECGGF